MPLWNVFTVEVIPPQVKTVEADNYTPGRNIPQCCVLASCTGEATTVEALRHVLKFSGTQTPKSYLLCRGECNVNSTILQQLSQLYLIFHGQVHSLNEVLVYLQWMKLQDPQHQPQVGMCPVVL